MLRRLLLAFFTLITCASVNTAFAKQLYSLVQVDLRSPTDLETVRSLHLDVVVTEENYVDVVIDPERLQILDNAGLSWRVQIPDMASFYRDRLAGKEGRIGSMGGYRTLAEIYLAMDSIANENPGIVKAKWSIGQTLEERPIYVMKISDNPEVDEDEPEVYYNGDIHAREVITPELLIRFMRHLTNNYGIDPQVTYLVDNREMFFNPSQNPDGYYYNQVTNPDGGGMWRKNRRDNGDGSVGIDLNRNYGYMWGYDNYGSSPDGNTEIYRGTGPFSEPETQVVRDFVLSRNFKVVVSYHSYTPAILWPWAYNCSDTPDEALLQSAGDLASLFNGYFADHMCGINGCSGDWYYGEQTIKPKIIEFLVEVGTQGDGFWPALERITPLVEENIQPNMIYARFAGETEFLQPPIAPILTPIGVVDSLPLTVTWSHPDALNPAVGFDVWKFWGLVKFADDLETLPARWVSNGFYRTNSKSHSPQYSYWSRNTLHTDYTLTATSPIKVASGDSVTFWIWYDIVKDWNYGYLEIEAYGKSWISIPGNITTTSNPNGLNLGHGFTGTSPGWVKGVFDISGFAGESITYRIRYVDEAAGGSGLYVDDIYPIDDFAEHTLLAEDYPDTSLTVTALGDGENLFQVFAYDAENQRSEGSNVEMAVYESWVPGDADGSGAVDISDVVYIVAYIFAGGPAPDPLLAGDANCDDAVDISDAVYLVDYIFGSGPAPCKTFR